MKARIAAAILAAKLRPTKTVPYVARLIGRIRAIAYHEAHCMHNISLRFHRDYYDDPTQHEHHCRQCGMILKNYTPNPQISFRPLKTVAPGKKFRATPRSRKDLTRGLIGL